MSSKKKMGSTTGSIVRHLTPRENHKIVSLLDEYVEIIDHEKGTCRYRKGMSDADVAELTNAAMNTTGITHEHVKRRRHDLYGEIPRPKAQNSAVEIAVLKKRLQDLEERLTTIEDLVG